MGVDDLWCWKVLHEVYCCRKAVALSSTRSIDGVRDIFFEWKSSRFHFLKEATFFAISWIDLLDFIISRSKLMFYIRSLLFQEFFLSITFLTLALKTTIWNQIHTFSVVATSSSHKPDRAFSVVHRYGNIYVVDVTAATRVKICTSVHNADLSYHRKHKFKTTLCH